MELVKLPAVMWGKKLVWSLGMVLLASAGCQEELLWDQTQSALQATCTVLVQGKGTKQVETDYLPHVIACESGYVAAEALKAQAVAARTYMYYRVLNGGSVKDGTGDQAYTCNNQPDQTHYDAVNATSGQVLMYSSEVICSFFVAGAKPSSSSCVATSYDPDSSPATETYVTYNWGLSGSQVEQSSIGYVSANNPYNRGCLSQNGAVCLADQGWDYQDILRFYYGADINIVTAQGSCVIVPGQQDASVPPPDQYVPPADLYLPQTDLYVPPADQNVVMPQDSATPQQDTGGTPSRPEGGVYPSTDLYPSQPSDLGGVSPFPESGLQPSANPSRLLGGCAMVAEPGWGRGAFPPLSGALGCFFAGLGLVAIWRRVKRRGAGSSKAVARRRTSEKISISGSLKHVW